MEISFGWSNTSEDCVLIVFVGARLHVTGGVLRGGRSVEGEASIAVLDTAAGVWLDRNGIVSSSRSNKGHDYDPSLELMRRCRHAAAAFAMEGSGGRRIFHTANLNYYGVAAMVVGFWKVAHHPPQLLGRGSYTCVPIDLLPIEFMRSLLLLMRAHDPYP
ncbi:hypothetical protein V8G54_030549 [Vigna mungo]|uniref:Uncharacterized protein n=1 Tax=Vigna mungo TaxID=3915 RepID=A0AAQ3RMZ0_VIGMU